MRRVGPLQWIHNRTWSNNEHRIPVIVVAVKIPTALVIMGSLMCIVATSIFSIQSLNESLFQLGVTAIGIGVGSWIVIQIYNYTRIIAARRRRRELRVKSRSKSSSSSKQRPKQSMPSPQQFRRFR